MCADMSVTFYINENVMKQGCTDHIVYWWISLSGFHFEWSGGQPQMHRKLCFTRRWANDLELHIFATKHKADTYNKYLTHSNDYVFIQSWPHSNIWRHMKPKNSCESE